MVVGLSTQLISTTAVLVVLVGWKSVAIAVAAVLLITPIHTQMTKHWTAMLVQNWKFGRDRSAVLHDALLAIRQIKLSAAESSWKQRIYQIREKEMRGYSRIAWLRFWMVIVGNISPAILSGVPIYVYAWQGHALTASVAFTFINLFNDFQSKLSAIPRELPAIRAGWASAVELDAFLRKAEICEPQFVPSDTLSLRNATITWHSSGSETEAFRLENLEADFPTGKLSIITGKTGCGKSLLLSALAGEAKILSGDIGRPPSPPSPLSKHGKNSIAESWVQPGTFALVSQNPWMDNASIQDNILFGLPMNEERYARVLYCCALEKDLTKLKDGDMAVISIKGVSLSGGQRSRIALARALYSRASFLLMDDVLSAVDAEICEWIVDKALCGTLANGRTRVLVTHHQDQVRTRISYRLRILNQTAMAELVSNPPTPTGDGFDYTLSCWQREHRSDRATPTRPAKPGTVEEGFRIAPYIMYFNASGGTASWLPALASLIVCEWSRIAAYSWLEEWVSGAEDQTRAATRQPTVTPGQAYMLMSALTTLTLSLRGVVMFRIYRTASKRLFGQIIDHVFGAPLQWIESASHGDILHCCDRDMRNVDEGLTYAIGPLFALVSQLVTFIWKRLVSGAVDRALCAVLPSINIGYSASMSWYDTPIMIGLFYLFFIVGRDLIPATKCLAAIEAAVSSAYLQHRSSLYAADGVPTARAYGMRDHFFHRANQTLDRRASSMWYSSLHSIVTEFQIGSLGAAYVALSCYSIAISGLGAGAVGTTLSFAMQLSETVSGCIKHLTAMNSGLVAAEKLESYGSVEQEPVGGLDIGDSWPEEGKLQVSNYTAGYGPGLPDTLRDVSFTLEPGERVGVVGRTGAGKSTLALSFARLIEQRGGTICIDSVDISHIKPEVLRRRILIIPQDPHLFGDTLRAVIDPDGAHTDEDLVACLQHFQFLSSVNSSGGNNSASGALHLSSMVSDGGANLSQGQRQILCLVKATLLRKKVVIMDEATSAVDIETDSAIQGVIQEGLRDTTVIVIAHRLATVAHLDKVLVMQDGTVVEFGRPAELYQLKGRFWALVNHSVDKDDLVQVFSEK